MAISKKVKTAAAPKLPPPWAEDAKAQEARAATVTPIADPKKVAKLVDELYATREKRYAINKEADKLEAREREIRKVLVASLPKFGATGVAGRIARAQLEGKVIAKVVDWLRLRKYIVKRDAWDILQRRVNDKAVAERWDAKKLVDGVEPDTVTVVSLHKV